MIIVVVRKKNISIDDDVYEALLDIGRKRDTFSDIIRRCIRAYRNSPESQIPLQGQSQQAGVTNRLEEPVIDHKKSFEKIRKGQYPRVAGKWIVREKPTPIEIEISGLKFPADKNEIIESAKKGNNSKQILDAFNLLPHRKYHDDRELAQFVEEAIDSMSDKESKSKPKTQQVKS
jgi:predicted CopG family antitoxin